MTRTAKGKYKFTFKKAKLKNNYSVRVTMPQANYTTYIKDITETSFVVETLYFQIFPDSGGGQYWGDTKDWFIDIVEYDI